MKRGEVYWVNIKDRLDHVQDGFRPCVVVQNDRENAVSNTTVVCPLTASIKRMDMATHVLVKKGLPKESTVLCEQIFTVDKANIGDYVATLDDWKMREISVAIMVSLGIL